MASKRASSPLGRNPERGDVANAFEWLAENHPKVLREMPGAFFYPFWRAEHATGQSVPNYVDTETGKPVAVNPDTGKWETVG